jgi:CheY-like chemotaxis protein
MAMILIIEDETELVKVLRSYLEKAGFNITTAYRGDTGLSTWEHKHPDLVILDLNLPGMDGLDVACAIRRKSNTPIIMLTARVEETDQLIGLELGADDYILKPFSPRVVVARVRAILRRFEDRTDSHQVIHVSDLTIDNTGNADLNYSASINYYSRSRNILVSSGFEDVNFPPDGWSSEIVSGDNDWQQDGMYPYEGSYCAWADGFMIEDARLISPSFLASGNTQLSYYVKTDEWAMYGGSFGVEVSADGTNWSFLDEIESFISIPYRTNNLEPFNTF